jgi:uncharacterized protein YlaN (UPF0358 family)
MEQFQREMSDRLNQIKSITEILKQIHTQRLYANGNVREAYTEVLRTELFRMMREIDDYKIRVCQELADIDAESVMNLSRFPSLSNQNTLHRN